MHIGLAVKTHMLSHGVASGLGPCKIILGSTADTKGGRSQKMFFGLVWRCVFCGNG
jgi:hypothetical protein